MKAKDFSLTDLKLIIFGLLDINADSTEPVIDLNTRFVEDLRMDSLALVSLVFLIEEATSIDMSTRLEDLANLKTVGDTLSYLEQIK